MPDPTTKTFSQLIEGQAAAVQARAAGLMDYSIGSILRAVGEAFDGVALWLQGLILVLLATTRASTSQASDLDTWMGDFGFPRVAATVSGGHLTFGRLSTTGVASVPAGAQAQTPDGSQQFIVVADPTNGAWNAGLMAYTLADGVGTVLVKAQSINAAAAANVLAGTITEIASAVPGMSTVTNALAFAGGSDAETDASYRDRFVGYLATLSEGTKAAIKFAVKAIQPGLFVQVLQNVDAAGAPLAGNLEVYVDDGTGAPSSPLLAAAGIAVDVTRADTITFEVHGPGVVTANVAMTLTIAAGYVAGDVATAVQTAIGAYISALDFGVTLPFTKLANLAYDASAGVANVTLVTLNTATADLTATQIQVVRPGTFTIATI